MHTQYLPFTNISPVEPLFTSQPWNAIQPHMERSGIRWKVAGVNMCRSSLHTKKNQKSNEILQENSTTEYSKLT